MKVSVPFEFLEILISGMEFRLGAGSVSESPE